MTPDILIEELSAIVETDAVATVYRNAERQLHRTRGPAVIFADGKRRYWYQNGKRHRTDGPAVEFADGFRRWFINGEEFCEEDFRMRVATGDYHEP